LKTKGFRFSEALYLLVVATGLISLILKKPRVENQQKKTRFTQNKRASSIF